MQLEQMEIFYYVCVWNSFSRAAEYLNLSKGYVSKEISRLEKELKIKLLNRTTRYVGMTSEGEVLFNNCAKIVESKQVALNQMKDLSKEPSGNLTISVPPSICDTVLANLFLSFSQQYPKINLIVDSTAIVKNLAQHAIDIALRLTSRPDENYVARLIKKFRFVICASENYLKKNGILHQPEEILLHKTIIYNNDPHNHRWEIGDKSIIVNGIVKTNSYSLVKKYLLNDLGIARIPEYLVSEELKSEQVRELFLNYPISEIPLYAIYHSGANLPLKIKYFLTFLKEYLASGNCS